MAGLVFDGGCTFDREQPGFSRVCEQLAAEGFEGIRWETKAVAQSLDATRNAVRQAMAQAPDYTPLSGGLDPRHVLVLAREFGVEWLCCTAGRQYGFS